MTLPLVDEVVRGVPVRCYRDRARSPVELLEQALERHARRLLLVDPALGRSVSYREFSELVEGAAAELSQRCRPGGVVAVCARNGLEAAVAIWACSRAGLVHLGLPVDAPPLRLAELVELTGACLVLAQPGLGPPGAEDATSLLLGTPRPWQEGQPLPDEDTTYALIATSGTTGRPKAVQVTGRMLGHATEYYAAALELGPEDRTAIHLPFAWVSGHVTQLAPVMRTGGAAVTMAEFTAAGLVRTVAEHSVTWLDVVPSIFELLLRQDLRPLAGVRLAVFGGAAASPATLDRVRRELPGMALHDVYALSETCAPVTCLPDGERARHPGSVGRPVPYADVRLITADGAVAAPGEPGELQVRSPAVTPGYWAGSEPDPFTDDGWLRTGDLAVADEAGYLRVVGRAVDLIIRGGVNVYPAEVERALLAAGGLADVAVVGVPSAVTGQAVAAFVVPAEGEVPDLIALRQSVAERVGRHAVPRPLCVVWEIPRNPNGKVDKAVLAAKLTGR